MSFLVEDDQQATLEVALAYIDYWADDDRTTASSSCGGSPSSSVGGGGFSSSDVRSTDDDADSDDRESSTYASKTSGHSGGGGAPGTSSRASLRVVIRTTNNKKLAVDHAVPAHPHAHAPYKRASANSSSSFSSGSGSSAGGGDGYRNKNSVLRFRARKKAETALLRDEAAVLEAQLAQLRGGRTKRLKAVSDGEEEAEEKQQALVPQHGGKTQLWMELAALQARERAQAEALNQQLKDAVEKQQAMGQALEAMMHSMAEAKKTSNFGLDLLSDAQKQSVYNDPFGTQEHRAILQLHMCSAEMRRAVDSLFRDESGVTAPTLTTATLPGHPDGGTADAGGSYVEIRSSAPMRCSFRDGGELIWKLVSTPGPVAMRTYSMKRCERTESSFLKIYTLFLGRPGGTVEVHGCSLVNKYVDADRVVVTWASSLTASSASGPTFRERGWVVVSRSTDGNPAFPSVLQVCHQVFSDDHASRAASGFRPSGWRESAEETELREFVLGHIVRRTRGQYQNIQSLLSDMSGRFLAYAKMETPSPEILSC